MSNEDRIGKNTWFDIPARDDVDARSFYEGLFNWRFLRMDESAVSDYWVIQAGEDLIGGLRKTDGAIGGAGAILYFTVDDLGAYARRVKELGGALEGGPVDLGKKRGAIQMFRDREKNLAAFWAPAKEARS